MPKICYLANRKRFTAASQQIIERANTIIAEYSGQGLRLTLRQLYYQFVSRDWLPNRSESYNRLGNIITDGRMDGQIDWNAIEDRTRSLDKNSHWDNPDDIISAVARSYQLNKWIGQEYQPEVWIEKEALSGVFERPCRELDVPFFACRGYTSVSAMWEAAERLLDYRVEGREPVILHFGDHDPSGIDMTRDIQDRLSTFMRGMGPDVRRIALNMDQIDQYEPPPNPAKVTDSRFESYQVQFGDESWELDALEPATLNELIRSHVLEYRDEETWDARCQLEDEQKAQLQKASDNWSAVSEFLDTVEDGSE